MINGICFGNAIISGCNNLSNSRKAVDELNIFPVPDGDTGTNMSMTISSAANDMNNSVCIGEVAKSVASLMLRGARGNSGVILSIIFKGFGKGLDGIDEASGKNVIDALEIGVKDAYGTITNPTEGTILTVARIAYETGLEACALNDDPVYVWNNVCSGAKKALDTTPELLPVLKRAGVVDAGGKGLLLIFEGMLSVFENGEIIEKAEQTENISLSNDSFAKAAAQFDEEINFTYCTEFIIRKNKDADKKSTKELKEYLESIGDCVLTVDDDEIIKVHVHTNDPGLALQKALKFGDFLTVKIENMREQNLSAAIEKQEAVQKFEFAKPENDFGFVCVSAGDGLEAVFKDLGCDNVVTGGQTMNPSTENLVEAVNATPAKTVYILPNNKNILLAAEQASDIVTDRKVVVVRTRTIPQGIVAMMTFDSSIDYELNKREMETAASKVATGQVTFAARKSEFSGFKIKKNDIIALENGKLVVVDKNPVKALQKLAKRMINKKTEFVTVIYGEDIDEQQAKKAKEAVESKAGFGVEVNLIKGNQPIYYFILSVE